MAIPLFLFTDSFSVASPSTNLSDSHWFFFPGEALLPVIAETINNMGGRGREGEGGEPQGSQHCTQPTGFSLPHIWFTVVPSSRGKMLSCWKYTWKAALPQRYHICILITHTLSCLELFLTKRAETHQTLSHLLLRAAGSPGMGSDDSCLQKRDGRGMGRNSSGPKWRGKEASLDEISPSSRKIGRRVSAQEMSPCVNKRAHDHRIREGPGKESHRQTGEYLRKGL